jgi:hexosaminidase
MANRPGDEAKLGSEGYQLDTSEKKAVIWAFTPAGWFYGRQTLKQITAPDGTAPRVRITDRPRFAYRGLLLDSARHMYSIEYIKRTIDLLASYKINRLHWHLTDDVGWRVQIDKYPKLTEVGAWRGEGGQGRWRTASGCSPGPASPRPASRFGASRLLVE